MKIRNISKVIAFLLCLGMVLPLFTFAVYADEPEQGPAIQAEAVDSMSGQNLAFVNLETSIVDTVSYTGLEVGSNYSLTGVLMDKDTGTALLVGEEVVKAEKAFTADSESGTIDLAFNFDSSELMGKSVVVFVTLYQEVSLDVKEEVASLEDIDDAKQTIAFKNPEISITATDKESGTNEANVSENTTIIAEISYKDLIPGKDYYINGVLFDIESGLALIENEYGGVSFKSESDSGTVKIEFNFDSTELKGKSVAVVAALLLNSEEDMRLLALNYDIQNEGQTVTFKEASVEPKAPAAPSKPAGTPVPKTGDTNNLVIGFLIISNLGAALIISKKKRTTK